MLVSKTPSRSRLSTETASAEKVKVEATEVVIEIRDPDDARLAELGYKGEFRREFSVRVTSLHT